MSAGRIWTPDQKLTTAPTFTRREIGGLPVDVLDDAPPQQVAVVPEAHMPMLLAVLGVQCQALFREVLELRERLESLEANEPIPDEPTRPITISHHAHHEPGEPGDE